MDFIKSVTLVGIGVAIGFAYGISYSSKVLEADKNIVYDRLKDDASALEDEAVSKACDFKQAASEKIDELKEKFNNANNEEVE